MAVHFRLNFTNRNGGSTVIKNSLLITITFDAYAFHLDKSAAFFFPFVWWDTFYRVFIRQQSRFRDPVYRPLPPENWKLTCKHWAMEKSGELRRIQMVEKFISVMAKNWSANWSNIASLQCTRSLGAPVHIFVLGRHLGFSNSGGLGRGDIRRGSRG